jgi:hypothetical protein
MSWTDDMARTAQEQKLILIKQMLAELKLGPISKGLKTAIKAHEDLVQALGQLGEHVAPRLARAVQRSSRTH